MSNTIRNSRLRTNQICSRSPPQQRLFNHSNSPTPTTSRCILVITQCRTPTRLRISPENLSLCRLSRRNNHRFINRKFGSNRY
ncbi:MAG: hypothetical protein F6K17_31345 [Okeania sp. SIO3C4]|nr:hypothetical protein [Okeania sp. SIO3C4]